ncbi:MAG: type I glyceraldehyde-3-phosphate dehydrogenase [Flavobacteriales bacterium]
MSKPRIAINGFGRIGRMTTRVILERNDLELVAINDLTDNLTLAHLFKYDSVHGVYRGTVAHDNESLVLGGRRIRAYSEAEPSRLPWKELGIDVVIEATGRFRSTDKVQAHLNAGAQRVILSAPASDDTPTVVFGVNEKTLTGKERVISNASCTTNNAAPMIQALDELCGIQSGYVTTIHSYTGDQRLHDAPHEDLRRARAAAVSIVPTTTGAAKAITRVFPHLDGKMGGCGIRVPVPDGSLTDITCLVRKSVTVEAINAHFKALAEGRWKNILRYTEDPIVSIDIVGDPHSCIFDAGLTSVVGDHVKVVGWYDNEWGYSNRLVDLVVLMQQLRA